MKRIACVLRNCDWEEFGARGVTEKSHHKALPPISEAILRFASKNVPNTAHPVAFGKQGKSNWERK
jgi:hypothetical protein